MNTARDLRGADPIAEPVAGVAPADSALRRAGSVAAVLALVSVPLFFRLGAWPLMDPDEGRNAEIAREMLAAGSWLVPHFNGLPFLDKPVGLFWMIAAAFRLVGVGELGARLPSALGAVVLMLTTFAIARRMLGTREGLVAVCLLGTAPLVLIFGRLTIFDMPFTALVAVAIWALVEGRLSPDGRRWHVLAGLAMGCATLTKGPVGVAVPMLAWLAARGSLPRPNGASPRASLGRSPMIAASLAFVVVVAPWVIAVAAREPGFLRYALVEETFLRFAAPERFNRSGPVYLPTLVLLGGFGVWSAVLAAVAPALMRRAGDGSSRARAIRFVGRMAVAILVLFTMSASKRPGYVLPALVPLAILTAVGILEAPRRAAAAVRVVAVCAMLVGLAVSVGTVHEGWFAGATLAEANPAFTGEVLLAGGTIVLIWGVFTAASSRAWPVATLVLAGVLMPAFHAGLLGPLSTWAESRSARGIAGQIDPQAELIAYRAFPTSLPFYRRRAVPLASESGRELTSNYVLWQLDRFRAGDLLDHPRDVWARLAAPPPVYVLAGLSWERLLRRRSPRPLARVGNDGHYVLLATQ